MSRTVLLLVFLALILGIADGAPGNKNKKNGKKNNKGSGGKNSSKSGKNKNKNKNSESDDDGPAALTADTIGNEIEGSTQDVFSFSDLTLHRTTSLKISVVANISDPDFSIYGMVEITYNKLTDGEDPLVLDTLNLEILEVRQKAQGSSRKINFALGEHVADKGLRLSSVF